MSAHSLFLSFSLPSCSLLYAKCACVKTCGAASNSCSKDGDLGRQTHCRPTYSSFPCHGRQHVSVLLYCCTVVQRNCEISERVGSVGGLGERRRMTRREGWDEQISPLSVFSSVIFLIMSAIYSLRLHLSTFSFSCTHSLALSLPIARSFAGRPHYLLVHKRSIVRVTALRITAKVEHTLHLNPHQQCLIPFPTPTPPPTPPVLKNMQRHLS